MTLVAVSRFLAAVILSALVSTSAVAQGKASPGQTHVSQGVFFQGIGQDTERYAQRGTGESAIERKKDPEASKSAKQRHRRAFLPILAVYGPGERVLRPPPNLLSAGKNPENLPASYGAIAYSAKSGSYKIAVNAKSESEARTESHIFGPGRSQTVIVFRDCCAALAVGNGGVGVATGDTKSEAERTALHECQKSTKNCALKCSGCSVR